MRLFLIALFCLAYTSTAKANDECNPTPTHLINRISERIVPETSFAIKSKDFEKVYFVSGAIKHHNDHYFAVWSTNTIEEGAAMIMSINNVANQLTPWPLGSQTQAAITMEDDGAEEVYDCMFNAAFDF